MLFMSRKLSLILAVTIGLAGCHHRTIAAEPTLTALRNHHFAQLDLELTAEQRSFERDPVAEKTVGMSFSSFALCTPKDALLLKEWVEADPRSFAPHLARAVYLFRQGWIARGEKVSGETSEDQFSNMEGYFRDGAAEAKAALQLNPRLSIAYRLIIVGERTNSSLQSIYAVVQAGLRQTPASFAIREGFMLALLPRWGGSYDAMERFAADSQTFAKQNPRLHRLLGYADWDRGDVTVNQDPQASLAYYNRALQEGGDYSGFYDSRGKAYYWLKRYDEARSDLNRAKQLDPSDLTAFEYLAWVASARRDPHGVLENIDAYRRFASPDPDLLKLEQWALDFQQATRAVPMPGHAGGD
jgi:tetratricopeptide (TPR) repeat protein